MLTRLTRRQLKVFAVLATVAMALIVFSYARVPAMVGIGVYDTEVHFADASGLYPKAAVTYRGVKIGQVDELELTDDGTVAVLRLDNDVKVPKDVVAELHSTSAVGEQYVDLVPESADGPYLDDDSVIAVEQTREMPQISPALDSLNALLESVPKRQTRQVLGQVDTALGSSEADLAGVIDGSSDLVSEAQLHIDETTALIAALEPVLATQNDLAPETLAYAGALGDLTTEVAAHDADLRSLLRSRKALSSTSTLIDEVQPALPLLLANLITNGEVLATYLPNLEQTLVVYPATIARLQSTVNPRARFGDVQLDLRSGVNNPPHCTDGYLGVDSRRSPKDGSVRQVDGLAHCKGPGREDLVGARRQEPPVSRPGTAGSHTGRVRPALRPRGVAVDASVGAVRRREGHVRRTRRA